MQEIFEEAGVRLPSALDETGDREVTEERLRHHRNHDQLTGLPNHLKFREKLKSRLNDPTVKTPSGAVFLLDVDRFKEVNHSFGLGVADNLLVALSDLLKDKISETETLARFGGDEFIVLSPGKSRGDAESLAAEIIRDVRTYDFEVDDTSLQVTVSAGFSLYPEQGNTANQLLAQADIALEEAKRSGRNQFRAYDPDNDGREESQSKVGWAKRIDSAIKENDLVLYAQPILELSSDNILCYEVLVRMSEKGGKLIPPGDFLPVAEKFGLSRDIDRWVVSKTLDKLSRTGGKDLDHQFAINLSGQSLTDSELLEWLKARKSPDGKGFEKILFEVTENAALAHINSANNFISALKARGSKFALDDFGMGFSSFNYLRQLSVDYLKIDGSFVQNLPRDSMNQDLVPSIVEVAHKLRKETIAEFVEDEETLRMVKNYGSDHAQGYHIGRPQPIGTLL